MQAEAPFGGARGRAPRAQLKERAARCRPPRAPSSSSAKPVKETAPPPSLQPDNPLSSTPLTAELDAALACLQEWQVDGELRVKKAKNAIQNARNSAAAWSLKAARESQHATALGIIASTATYAPETTSIITADTDGCNAATVVNEAVARAEQVLELLSRSGVTRQIDSFGTEAREICRALSTLSAKFAKAREERNRHNFLLRLLEHDALRGTVLASLSIRRLCIMRRISRQVAQICNAELAARPRPVVCGMTTAMHEDGEPTWPLAIETLDLSTMRWSPIVLELPNGARPTRTSESYLCAAPRTGHLVLANTPSFRFRKTMQLWAYDCTACPGLIALASLVSAFNNLPHCSMASWASEDFCQD